MTRDEMEAAIELEALRFGVRPELVKALVRAESNWDPGAIGPETKSGRAKGLFQFVDATAREMGIDPMNPAQAIKGGIAYLRMMLDRFGGDERLALAAYNAGPTRVAQYGGVPPFRETQDYIKKIIDWAGTPAPAPAPAPQPVAQVPAVPMPSIPDNLRPGQPQRGPDLGSLIALMQMFQSQPPVFGRRR